MLFTSSLFGFTYYLQAPFFHLHVIYKFPFSIFMLLTDSLFRYISDLQAPFFDLHVIHKLSFSIYMLYTSCLFRFTCYLQAPFFELHLIYRFSFLIYICYLQAPFSFRNWDKLQPDGPLGLYADFTYLSDLHVIHKPPFPIYMSFRGSLFRFTCYLQTLSACFT